MSLNRPYDPKEQYFTPERVILKLITDIQILKGVTSVLEPCAGTGNIVKMIRRSGYDHHLTAVEIDPLLINDLAKTQPDNIYVEDYFNMRYDIGKFDLIIVNPPYKRACEFIESCYARLNRKGQLAAFLRLSFMAGVKNHGLINNLPPTQIWVTQRESITGGCGDIGGHAWYIWDKPLTKKPTTIHWLPLEVRKTNDPYSRRFK